LIERNAQVPLMEINRNPTDRQLRQFGVIGLVLLPLLAWWWEAGPAVSGILAAAGLFIGVAAMIRPASVQPLFVGLTLLTAPLVLIGGELAMLLVFWGVVLPVGFLLRVSGRKMLPRHADPDRTSYWQSRTSRNTVKQYFRQW